ncbi:hypothetical protein ABAC460_16095 [Asticcacaulis sp. AC460]|uniref:hypothetical protein n=1 Tax=Asticcacaulis sp. AC460 TaxID=1282360 RepID=UPI0003C3E49D|nr:hypothetical protein [Asticcacaulis sp. AC460]ESQ88181.1 hypothetical protein ABAC460_16095 [Asticcacaulis sp. AC460]
MATLAFGPALAWADEAVFADGRLWTVHGGEVVSLAEGEAQARREYLGAPVISLCRQDGHPVALALASDSPDALRIHKRDADGWTAQATLPEVGKEEVALLCVGDDIVVVTEKDLITIDDAGVRKVALQAKFSGGRHTFLGTADDIYVGYDMGEWGGGLQAIRRSDGQVRKIEKNKSGDLCDGPLNGECDPVNAIAIVPWKPQCVAVAVGLSHLNSSHGRIVTVCGEVIDSHYARQFGERYANRALPEDEAYSTIPFYGLIAGDDSLLALGMDGLYRISSDGKATILPIPEFPLIDGMRVSFNIPGVVLIGGTRNRDDVYFATDIVMVPR